MKDARQKRYPTDRTGGTWVSCNLMASQVDPQIKVQARYKMTFSMAFKNGLQF